MHEQIEILKADYRSILEDYAKTEKLDEHLLNKLFKLSTIIAQSKLVSSDTTKWTTSDDDLETTEHRYPITFEDYKKLILDELEDAEKYAEYYRQTGERAYNTLSTQEKSHANVFIQKATALPDVDKIVLGELKKRYDSVK